MDCRQVFCPNVECPARGRVGQGNIGVHSQRDRRYICHVCQRTFSERRGTAFYRLRTPVDTVTLVVTLLAYGCPLRAIVAAFGFDERTVADWQRRAGQHCQRVHEHWVERPRDLVQVQADEIRVKMQGAIVWLAMALQVSTRLWLGGAVSRQRDAVLIGQVMAQVRRSALCRPLLFCVDGWHAYLGAIRRAFRTVLPIPRGRPRLRPWDDVGIAQVVKQYTDFRVTGIERRIAQGAPTLISALLTRSQGAGDINTAYIERLNGTFRSRLASLRRKSRSPVHQMETLHWQTYLMGTIYNFCTDHDSLRVPGLIGGHRWLPRTPAIAAAITDHRWSVQELLARPVPLQRWVPPKCRGAYSQPMRDLIARWA